VLRELYVRNLAVVAEAALELGPGLNVLSGETGAGKSIVVDSLSLLAGARASADLVRTGAEVLSVSGVFALQGTAPAAAWREVLAEAGLETAGDEVVVRREIGRNGRSRIFVNDQPATVRLLADLAGSLLRIHGQRDELGLLDAELQKALLDRSGGAAAPPLLARVADLYGTYSRLAERLERLSGDDRLRHERLDLLRFQAQELDAARLRAGEDTELRAERDVLRNAEAITRALGGAAELLFDEEGAAVERLGRGRTLLAEVEAWEPGAAAWGAELDELRIRLTELARALQERLEVLEADPARLDAVEDRLALVERLCRKHSGDIAAVLARRAEIAAELAELEGDAGNREELEGKVAAALDDYRTAALALSAARRRWAAELVEVLHRELKDLGLGRARLDVRLEPRRRATSPLAVDGVPVDLGRDGIDQVTFLFAPNPGEEPRPLARIASGGELSRIHLALQLASLGGGFGSEGREGKAGKAGRAGEQPTLIFDEVDSGVGGAEAAALGAKLQRLAATAQILVVTHLAQVASHGDSHFRVSKRVEGERTLVRVEPLDDEGRVAELARMSSGRKVTELSLSHARELLASAARKEKETARGTRR
jgi:DNA repair protein RecN (Recombination protein N)